MYYKYMFNKTSETPEDNKARTDITGRDSIIVLVDAFYERIRSDESLGPIFNNKIGSEWNSHLETMYNFWDSVLFRAGTFRGNPPLKHQWVHQATPLSPALFDRWLTLFKETLDANFEGPKALFAWRAAQDIASVLQRKLKLEHPKETIRFTS